ncbi:hypothetical protein ACWEV3_09385 [Saccharopolyspora sp. NPDC003752]
MSEPTLESALALGLKPVGVASVVGPAGRRPYLVEKSADAKVASKSVVLDEVVRALRG